MQCETNCFIRGVCTLHSTVRSRHRRGKAHVKCGREVRAAVADHELDPVRLSAEVHEIRERNRFWHSCPSRWLILSSLADVVVVMLLAAKGILMSAIPLLLIVSLFLVVVIFLVLIDTVKIQVFRYFDIR